MRVEDGKVLWTQAIKAFRGMNILTPVVAGDRVLTSSYGGETQGWSVTRKGEAWEVRQDWSLKVEGYMSTPVVVAGQAYLHSRSQKLICFDVATGAKRWESEEKFGKYMSLVAQGDRILALDERGILFLFRADASGFKPEGRGRWPRRKPGRIWRCRGGRGGAGADRGIGLDLVRSARETTGHVT